MGLFTLPWNGQNEYQQQINVLLSSSVFVFRLAENLTITYYCDPESKNQQKVAYPSLVLRLKIGDPGQHG